MVSRSIAITSGVVLSFNRMVLITSRRIAARGYLALHYM
jgi:hypothetical protein